MGTYTPFGLTRFPLKHDSPLVWFPESGEDVHRHLDSTKGLTESNSVNPLQECRDTLSSFK